MTDLIDRQAAIDVAVQSIVKWDGMFRQDANCRIRDAINELPSAQPERKTGRWILKPNIYGVAYCSECDYELHTNNTNYCPNCGADMRTPTQVQLDEADDVMMGGDNGKTD